MRSISFSIVHLVTLACLTSGILTSNFYSNVSKANGSSRVYTYIPSAIVPVLKRPEHVAHADHAANNEFGSKASPTGLPFSSGYPHSTHLYAAIRSAQIASFLKDKDKRPLSKVEADALVPSRKNLTESNPKSEDIDNNLKNHRWSSTAANKTSAVNSSEAKDSYLFRRSSYQVTEADDNFRNYYDEGGPYPARVEPLHSHSNSKDVTTAIRTLDRFLSGTLNEDGYNSELHPPPNPLLALVLSRYGRYVSGFRNPRVYAYMAVNNIHNNKPFGKYKFESDEEPDSYR